MSDQSEIESAKKETKIKVLQRALKAHFPYLSPSIEDEGDNNILLSFSLSDTEVLKSPSYTVESASKDLDNIVEQVKAITKAYQKLEEA